jgi:hypothetical protein
VLLKKELTRIECFPKKYPKTPNKIPIMSPHAWLILMNKGGAYPSKPLYLPHFIGQLLALLAYIKRAGSNLLGKNTLAYFAGIPLTKNKKVLLHLNLGFH